MSGARVTMLTPDCVRLPNGQEFTKVMQDISTSSGRFDIYSTE